MSDDRASWKYDPRGSLKHQAPLTVREQPSENILAHAFKANVSMNAVDTLVTDAEESVVKL